ncbi:rhodanese-like domain-containing protein [Chryseobacterium koreense]|uniref:rhodanese-like domain-containing protein n=1 Tax=Chryseobacterium koreense TaxID=232216 RepID=UPI0026F09B3A|nr:rhodanese-like domain-containing protein [Chryseobacterium koreense]
MKFLISVMIAGFVAISCKTAVNTVETPRPNMVELVNNPETTLVDVRIPSEFEEKTAKNAVNIPLAEIENNLDFFRKQKQVVLFCNRGKQAQSALDILKKHGIENVVSAKTLDNVSAIQNSK